MSKLFYPNTLVEINKDEKRTLQSAKRKKPFRKRFTKRLTELGDWWYLNGRKWHKELNTKLKDFPTIGHALGNY